MLVPDESTAGLNYFAYFVDEGEELRPLIIEQDGQPMWPTFDRSDIADHMANKASQLDAKLKKQEARQQEIFEMQEPDYIEKKYEEINKGLLE